MSSTRSMKAVITTRVSPADADRLFSSSRQLGNPLMCPVSAQHPDVDEFSRPQGGAMHRMIHTNDAACSSYTLTVNKLLDYENAERPILGPCDPGNRGGADLQGQFRDHSPRNLYGQGMRGNFVNEYGQYLKPPEGTPHYVMAYEPATAAPLTISHDALIKPFYGG